MITLTYNGTTAAIGDRLQWINEYDWSPVKQSYEHSTDGALLVDEAVMLAGRPITLQGSETAAWISKALCDTLQAWKSLPNTNLVLVLRGMPRAVKFDLTKGGFTAQPIWKLLDGEITPTLLYVPTFHFLEI